MKKVRVALIGYGRSGRDIHRRHLRNMGDRYEIVAYADEDADRRAMILAETGVEAYDSYQKLLTRKDIDLVVNASFSHQHQPISIDLLKHGFDVLSEKPVATSLDAFQAILDTERQSKGHFFAFQQYRYSPAYNKIREVIASGALGRIVQISMRYEGFMRRWDWQTIHAWAAGSLLNTGPHPIDMSLELMGFPQNIQVACVMDHAHNSGNGEDYDKLLLYAPGCPTADIEISSCWAFPSDTYAIQGTGGSLRGDSSHLEWKYCSKEQQSPRPLVTGTLKGEHNEPIYCREALTMIHEQWRTPDGFSDDAAKCEGFYRALHDTLTNGTPMRITSQQLMLQMKVMEAAHKQNAGLFGA